MRASILFFLCISSFLCLAQNEEKLRKDYILEVDDDGILVEKFDSTNIDENRFTKNNMIFREGVSFHYKYEHIDTTNNKYLINYIDSINTWEFVPVANADNNTILQVIISVKQGLQGFDKFIPDYNQTIIGYSYPTQDNYMGSINSSSGVIENEGNIWMHPPRDQYFEILELNPFPYIKAPYTIGTKWSWQLTIGDLWADGRWKLWSGQIQNSYQYEITAFKPLKTIFGLVDCYVIEGVAISRLGETRLKSYFNTEYG
ncbi:MAG: hypothetical protein WBM55_07450, partial [Muriicola sp.]